MPSRSIRVRVHPHFQDAVEKIAQSEGRSYQQVVDKLLKMALRSVAMPTPAPQRQSDGISYTDDQTYKCDVPLKGTTIKQIKTLADREGRSNRTMARELLKIGLRAYQQQQVAA